MHLKEYSSSIKASWASWHEQFHVLGAPVLLSLKVLDHTLSGVIDLAVNVCFGHLVHLFQDFVDDQWICAAMMLHCVNVGVQAKYLFKCCCKGLPVQRVGALACALNQRAIHLQPLSGPHGKRMCLAVLCVWLCMFSIADCECASAELPSGRST